VKIPRKVNLILLAVAAIVIELFAVVSAPFLENIARAEILQKARIMMEAAAGIRTYTLSEIAPLINAQASDGKFHAQIVPAYAATKNFGLLARKFRDYAYREAALNPINPGNRAVDWEADIINAFRQNPAREELVSERETANGRMLHLSHPIVSQSPCLACHGAVETAPRSMIAAYGTQNGFGWKLNEVVGAQIVSVPMTVALQQATRVRNVFIGVLACVLLLLIGLFNLLPMLMVTMSRRDARTSLLSRPRLATAQSVKAFGYGLFASGAVVVMVVYVVIYVKRGFAGLEEALNPFVPVNYASLAAVAPGVLTILLATYLGARARSEAHTLSAATANR
jgi:NADH:ubiquinone oxidoreductase subunit 6 (subunit J)